MSKYLGWIGVLTLVGCAEPEVLPLLDADGQFRGTAVPASGEIRVADAEVAAVQLDRTTADVSASVAVLDADLSVGTELALLSETDAVLDMVVIGPADALDGAGAFPKKNPICPHCSYQN